MSIDRLPIHLLADVFSRLSYADLYRAERVCQRWRSTIEGYVWKTVTCINLETIGYPEDGYQENFIRLARLVDKVKDFTCIYSIFGYGEPLRARLKSAILELVKKRTPDAAFPFDIIAHLVCDFEATVRFHSMEDRQEVVESTTKSLLQLFSVAQFTAFRLDTFAMHDPDPELSAFVVPLDEEEIPIHVDVSNVKRLTIEALIIRLAWDDYFDREALKQVESQIARLKKFDRLESVDVESVEMVMPFGTSGTEPYMSIKLYFHPHRCVLTKKHFHDLLVKMAHVCEDLRDAYLAEYVQDWMEKKAVKSAEMSIRGEKFPILEFLSLMGHTVKTNQSLLADTLKRLVGLLYPEVIDSFHVFIERDCDDEDNIVSTIMDDLKLKTLRVTFCQELNDEGERIEWDEYRGTHKARTILKAIGRESENVENLESLVLNFEEGGNECLLAMFEPMDAVKGPLPMLQRLECYGLPCFPFLISVLSQAPNLRSLIIESQPFERAYEVLDWVRKLVVALGNCKGLIKLSINIVETPGQPTCTSRKRVPRRAKRKGESIRFVWEDLKQKFNQLAASLSSLDHVEVFFDDDHQFKVNRPSISVVDLEGSA